MKQIFIAVRSYLVFTLILGLLYPLFMTGLAQVLFPRTANGSFIAKDGVVVGSELIGQKFTSPRYFWSRASAIDYNPLPSGGSNLAPTSETLRTSFNERNFAFGAHVPSSLVFASGSGLDPHIDLPSALFQVPRVAKAREVAEGAIRSKVMGALEPRQFGFLGEERVNVLKLNLALDQ